MERDAGWKHRPQLGLGTDVGIYSVGTAIEYRRRGLARALMQHLLAVAWQRDARTATLQATPMGQALYESLGFEAVGRYEEWVPRAREEASCATQRRARAVQRKGA